MSAHLNTPLRDADARARDDMSGARRRGRSPSAAAADEAAAPAPKAAKTALKFTMKKGTGVVKTKAVDEDDGGDDEEEEYEEEELYEEEEDEEKKETHKLKLSIKMKMKAKGGTKVSFLEEEELNDDGPSESDSELEDALWAGGDGFGDNDFSGLQLKPDHANRPLWVCDDGRIFLESFSPVYKAAYDFLISVAEPVCRPANMHEYVLTPHSLYAAVSVGLETATILSVLDRLSKTHLSEEIHDFVHECTANYGKVKLVLQRNKFYLESNDPSVLKELLADDVVRAARVAGSQNASFRVTNALKEKGAQMLVDIPDEEATVDVPADGLDAKYQQDFLPEYDPDRQMHSFEIEAAQVEHVKQRCLPGNLGYPTLEEYDFRNDTRNPDLPIELKPMTRIRPYQEKSLSKMFGNGRARSGIIVLPCGAGKSLTGIAAAARIRKSTLCLCTSSVSVDQWSAQFKLWTNLTDTHIVRFTSQNKDEFPPPDEACVCVTTYNMVSAGGKRSEGSERILEAIRSREWGCMLLDEVHVVPAAMFRKVIGITKAHCKLGLTATLVREDDKVDHLNFLIGPKLYEANWLDLQRDGHIANVQCVEVWCPMTAEFFRKYCNPNYANKKQVLYCMNPNKFMACQFLMQFHEQQRKDKVIVFSDNIFALREYATALRRPLIYGDTSHAERTRVLHAFKYSNEINTIFLSKVGDNSIDIPEANVIIQISSHAGSRRQEAQRLGRILRPKAAQLSGKKTNADEHNAFFYSLVSTDTAEMYYSTKRQQFLIQQGYAFKVVTDLIGPQDKPQLMFSTQEKQLDLLAKVLSAGEAEAGEEVLPDDEDAIKHAHKPAGAARRTPGSMMALSGADGAYLEFDAQRGKTGKPGSSASFKKPSGAPRSIKPKNSILRERDAMLRGKKR